MSSRALNPAASEAFADGAGKSVRAIEQPRAIKEVLARSMRERGCAYVMVDMGRMGMIQIGDERATLLNVEATDRGYFISNQYSDMTVGLSCQAIDSDVIQILPVSG